jgi:hypothetical protein
MHGMGQVKPFHISIRAVNALAFSSSAVGLRSKVELGAEVGPELLVAALPPNSRANGLQTMWQLEELGLRNIPPQ